MHIEYILANEKVLSNNILELSIIFMIELTWDCRA